MLLNVCLFFSCYSVFYYRGVFAKDLERWREIIFLSCKNYPTSRSMELYLHTHIVDHWLRVAPQNANSLAPLIMSLKKEQPSGKGF